ncbi:hypothetical protein F5J12DRAFT_896377 [Pisolithus orientalis]|uniref:uncharacterized protein n=1 Tax=Pisolithus orientalis TaxID=936130 RepID=UPI002223FF55|nr:uncharacterized protein F5J12DRAFT_896377 [Pisolithus orientalis]KAI5996037.1 hypothetical protein F5J12DRAFT_896377 [Pisolithus orientalis]
MSFVQQFQQAQQERSEAKCHHLQYGYWKENEKANSSLAECQHQLAMQHEQYANEEAMVAQELEKMKLTVKLEELQGQNLALQKGVAGEQPPHYLPHAIPDQDDDVDLDPVLPYMEQEEPIALPSTMWMPTPKPEMVQEVYDALATAEAVATEIELANINTAEFELLF